jgi:hypothetical protein
MRAIATNATMQETLQWAACTINASRSPSFSAAGSCQACAKLSADGISSSGKCRISINSGPVYGSIANSFNLSLQAIGKVARPNQCAASKNSFLVKLFQTVRTISTLGMKKYLQVAEVCVQGCFHHTSDAFPGALAGALGVASCPSDTEDPERRITSFGRQTGSE